MDTTQTTETERHEVCLAMGSNLGDSLSALRAAREALAPYISFTAISPVYETKAIYVTDQPDFLNAVVRGTTTLDPIGLLYTVRDVEIEIGRQPTFRYGPRVIDIDIIFFDNLVFHTTELNIPHKLMAEREFVLRPLADVAPDWMHPVLKKPVRDILAALPGPQQAKAIQATL